MEQKVSAESTLKPKGLCCHTMITTSGLGHIRSKVVDKHFRTQCLITYLWTQSLYFGISLAYSSLLEGESLLSLVSLIEQLSMNVWATTDRQESTMLDLLMSKTKSGFFTTLTQNLSGKLKQRHFYMQSNWKIIGGKCSFFQSYIHKTDTF